MSLAEISRARWRRLIAPGIAAFITFWLLIALGVWQLHRLKWKEAILANIHHAAISPPVPMPPQPDRHPFEKVFITGHWITNKAALYGQEVHDSPRGPISGGELIMPFRRDDGQIMLVDLGWVPEMTPKPYPVPAGETQATGYLHGTIKPGWFAGTDDPKAGLFYTLDPRRIAAGLGLGPVSHNILIAMGKLPPPGSAKPQPAQALPHPPNNHYGYALTWFGFALVLVF
ncbi:MAG: SURF1 family protein, partial [Acidocella sp.]|nr:SURF1 family protein [Acidocella sp.]